MTKPDLNDTELEALFRAARQAPPEPDAGFLATLEQDALRELARAPVPTPRFGFDLSGLLGGWRGMGGLAAAAVTGLWIGIAPPSGVPDPLDFFDQALTGVSFEYDPVFGADALDDLLQEDGDNV